MPVKEVVGQVPQEGEGAEVRGILAIVEEVGQVGLGQGVGVVQLAGAHGVGLLAGLAHDLIGDGLHVGAIPGELVVLALTPVVVPGVQHQGAAGSEAGDLVGAGAHGVGSEIVVVESLFRKDQLLGEQVTQVADTVQSVALEADHVVADGLGTVGLMFGNPVGHNANEQDVVRLPLDTGLHANINLVYKDGSLSNVGKAFLDFVRQYHFEPM